MFHATRPSVAECNATPNLGDLAALDRDVTHKGFTVLARNLLKWRVPVLACALLGASAVKDSRIAHQAQSRLIGLSEVDLESCIGAPDERQSFGSTDVLTYYATSTSSINYSLPIVGGVGFSNGAYCHATFRIDDGHVTRVLYSGEKNATLAPDAYCAPISRTCLDFLDGQGRR
jgi:hypothetical protein